VKIHIPQSHALNRTNFTLTLEDLLHRLNKMKIHYPICVYCSENNPTARLNLQQSMEGSIDGRDYISFLFVSKNELNAYKKRWPNQILVELPFEDVSDKNWRDLYRQAIKVFSETLGAQYTFMMEDNLYCVFKQAEGELAPSSLFEYLKTLQEAAPQTQALILGSRVSSFKDIKITSSTKEWENNIVRSCVLVKTEGNPAYFSKVGNEDDSGLVKFEVDCNAISPVQQNQKFILVCGYTIDDPVVIEKRQPYIHNLDRLEPELTGLTYKVNVISNEKVLDEQLSDGKRFARGLVVVGDTTASVIFIAINEQIELLKPGQNFILRNAKVVMYKGWMRIEVDDWGKVDPIEEEIVPNKKKNMSTVEYELVDSESESGGNDNE
jgi:replication factor A1